MDRQFAAGEGHEEVPATSVVSAAGQHSPKTTSTLPAGGKGEIAVGANGKVSLICLGIPDLHR